MTLERRLRDTLARRAAAARVTPGAWDEIESRLAPRRARLPILAAVAVPVAAAVLAVVLVTTGDGPDDPDVVAGPGGSTPTSTAGDVVSGGDALAVFPAVFRSDLEALQREVDAGHDPWLLDAERVAEAYLESRGVRSATLTADGAGAFVYRSGFVEGRLELRRLAGEGSIWYVATAGSGPVHWLRAAYGSHAALTLDVAVNMPGRVKIEVEAYGRDWDDTRERSYDGGSVVEVRLDVPGQPPPALLVIRAIHRTEAGEVTVVEDLLLAGSAIDGDSVDGGDQAGGGEASPEPCRADLAQGDAGIDTGAAAHLRRTYEEPAEVAMPDGSTERLVRTGFVVKGDRLRTAEAAEVCVRSYWASDPETGSGDAVGFTDGALVLRRDGNGAWSVVDEQIGRLSFLGEWTTAQVALLRPGAECGESDDEFELVQAAVVVEGEDPLTSALHALFTGFFVTGDVEYGHSLPDGVRLRSLEVDEQGVAHVDVSAAAEQGGGSCLMNARKEQIRRTALAQEGITNASISADGKTEDESFQP